MKYTGILIKRETKYVSGIDGSELVFQPTFTESSIDVFENTHKYLLIELYTKVGIVNANTLRSLETAAFNTGLYFDEIFIPERNKTNYPVS